MSQEATTRELYARLEAMEKSYEEKIRFIEGRHGEDLRKTVNGLKPELDPLINCIGCGEEIFLPTSYWNIEDSDVKCKKCGSLMTVTFTSGELKKITLKKQGSSS